MWTSKKTSSFVKFRLEVFCSSTIWCLTEGILEFEPHNVLATFYPVSTARSLEDQSGGGEGGGGEGGGIIVRCMLGESKRTCS